MYIRIFRDKFVIANMTAQKERSGNLKRLLSELEAFEKDLEVECVINPHIRDWLLTQGYVPYRKTSGYLGAGVDMIKRKCPGDSAGV